MDAAISRGWTSISEQWNDAEKVGVLEQLAADNALPLRVDAYLALNGVRPGEQAAPVAAALPDESVPSSLGPLLVMLLLMLVVVESLVGNWHLRIRRGVAA